MWISRVRATGGFLAGVDLKLTPGLNVVVGPRGSGKTTLLELLRHALQLDGPAAASRPSLLRHALGSGEIIIDVEFEHGSERLIVDAEGGGRRPDITSTAALMLGQNELEEIADDPQRRLSLLDLRAGLPSASARTELLDLSVLSQRRLRLAERIAELHERLHIRPSLAVDRERLAAAERDLMSQVSRELTEKRQELAAVESELLSAQQVQAGAIAIREDVSRAASMAAEIARLAKGIGVSAVAELQELAAKARHEIGEASSALQAVNESLETRADVTARASREAEISLRARAEPLRAELEAAEQGLGSTTAQLRNVDAQLARLAELDLEATHLVREMQAIDENRAVLLEAVEADGERRFALRSETAREITEALKHRVQITVQHLGDTDAFAATIAALLQGSGLKFAALSESLARDVLPTMLLHYVDSEDAAGLADAASIPESRAERVLAALRTEEGVSELASARLEDSVDFKLQDGSQLKSVAELSTGQKCAATLPIVLTDDSRLVILDQPEDHLDNLFLVSAVVSSLVRRTGAGSQTIVATHNPNVPVLGSASQVAYLKSDGVNGAVAASGPYDAAAIVSVITNLMEGGKEAFNARAHFYGSHQSDG